MDKITIKKGETYTKIISIYYMDTRLPVDLTGCSAYSEIRTEPDGDLIAVGTCTIVPSSGTVKAMWTSTQTEAIPAGEYGFDVWIVNGNQKHPIYTNRVQVVGRYTQSI